MNKQRSILLIILFASICVPIAAFAEGWERSLDLNLNAAQASYSDSWVGGEAGNVTWISNANGIFNAQLSESFTLKNTVKLAFGQTISQDKDDKTWSKPTKSTDKIDLESVGVLATKCFVNPYAALRFESQFLDAAVDTSKRYINPIVLTESAGFARQLFKKDKNDVMSRLGFAVKQNIDRIAQEKDPKKSKTTSDGGIESVTDAKFTLNDKLGYVGKLTLYRALLFSKKDELKGTEEEDDWKTIDVNWENMLTASISKYVQVSLHVQLLYDKQISKKGRLKQTLSFGLTYRLL